MADTPKKRTSTTKASTTTADASEKATTAAKPRKTAAKKSANAVSADPVASSNGHVATQGRNASHEDVARLAHTYWQQRGHKHGHHEEDWYRAEQELRGKAS